jgi:hypothetical protein
MEVGGAFVLWLVSCYRYKVDEYAFFIDTCYPLEEFDTISIIRDDWVGEI